jgi:hypothetical protein
MVATPGGKVASNQVALRVLLEIGSKTFPTHLVAMNLEGVDVILGMNWMTQHKVVLDIAERMLEINSPFVGNSILYLPPTGHKGSCVYAAITTQLEDIPVYASTWMSFLMNFLACHQTEMLSLSLSYSLALLLFLSDLIE